MLFLTIYSHHLLTLFIFSFFFFNDTATTEIYTLSLHDALPISRRVPRALGEVEGHALHRHGTPFYASTRPRSEEHTSELQSHSDLVCRLLLEKKKKKKKKSNKKKKKNRKSIMNGMRNIDMTI